MSPKPKPTPTGPTPPYAQKLNEWHDKEMIKAQETANQQILQDEIAVDLNLTVGQVVSVVYLNIAYSVTGVNRFQDGQEIISCTIAYRDVEVIP